VQILPPPDDSPRPPVENAEHPFILEFPMKTTDCVPVTLHRRMLEHDRLTRLINLLLAGRTSCQPRRPEHFWASVRAEHGHEIQWVQQFFFVKLGEGVVETLSPPAAKQLEGVEPAAYYRMRGNDGRPLPVPADLDESLCRYKGLTLQQRAKFDRAAFWVDVASRQWTISLSASFASLVSAVESLTDRGSIHRVFCEDCNRECQHEVPGATERFRSFFETYDPGATEKPRRSKMYGLRCNISHGSDLMQLEQDLGFGWDPPGLDERELHEDLWGLTRVAISNWLKSPIEYICTD
jgi:hypothetical protein